MKKLILFSITTLICLNLSSQNWSPLSTGISSSLPNESQVLCLVVYNNKLIVAGNFSSAGGNLANNIAAWDGASWSVLGTGLLGGGTHIPLGCLSNGAVNGSVSAMTVFNNELYVGGTFNNAGGVTVKNLAKWNGSTWSDVGGGVSGPQYSIYSVVNSLAVFNNELYVGGYFDTAGVLPVSNIVKWNGSFWSDVGSGIKRTSLHHVNAMITLNTDLYVGGDFDTAGVLPVSNIVKWNGSAWSALGPGIPDGSTIIGVTSLTTYNNMVYAGNTTSGISKWDGSNWQAVGGGLGNSGSSGWAFGGTTFGTDLIVGGLFSSSGLTQYTFQIAKWDNLSWNHINTPIGLGSGFANGCVDALTVYNGSLYAGGSFSSEFGSSSPLNKIAKFIGTVGINENSNPELINIYPNPSSGMIYLELPKEFKTTSISIYSSTGELVYSGMYSNQVDVSNFASGVYFLTIPTETGVLRKGFVVEHK